MSIKRTEAKYVTDKNNNLVKANCPICACKKETRQHYNYDCPQMRRFREKVAEICRREDFNKEEWNLKTSTNDIQIDATIAKARWIFHCERCKVDHKRRRRINLEVLTNKVKTQIEVIRKLLGEKAQKEELQIE